MAIKIGELPEIDTAGTQLDLNYQQRSGYLQTKEIDPDRFANVNRIANKTGMSPQAVEHSYDAAVDADKQPDWKAMREKTPVLYNRYADPKFSALARDDSEALSNIERIGKQNKPDFSFMRILGVMGDELKQGVKQLYQAKKAKLESYDLDTEEGVKDFMRQYPLLSLEIENSKDPDIVKKLREEMVKGAGEAINAQFAPGVQEKIDALSELNLNTKKGRFDFLVKSGSLGPDFPTADDVDGVKRLRPQVIAKLQNEVDKPWLDYSSEYDPRNGSSGELENTVRGITNSLPAMGLMAFGPPGKALGADVITNQMLGSMYESEKKRLSKQGLSEEEVNRRAFKSAEIGAYGGSPLEWTGNLVDFLLFRKAATATSILGTLGAILWTGVTEGMEEGLQFEPEMLGRISADNPDNSFTDNVKELWSQQGEILGSDEMFQNVKYGVLGGWLLGGSAKVISYPFVHAANVKRAEQTRKWVEALKEAEKMSALKERSPEEVVSFINDVAGGQAQVYLQADILKDIADDSDLDPMAVAAEYGVSKEDMQYALDTGGDIEITTGNLVTNNSENGTLAHMLGHLKPAPDAVDVETKEQDLEDHAEVTARETVKVLREKKRQLAQEERDYVKQRVKAHVDNLRAGLKEAGYNGEDVETMVSLAEARAEVWSKRTHKQESEWWDRMGLSIKRGTTAEAASALKQKSVTRETLDDSIEVEVNAVSPNGDVVRAKVGARTALNQTDEMTNKLSKMLEECL